MVEPDQTPCVGSSMYWSDYDDLQIAYVTQQNGVKWISSFADSTSGLCTIFNNGLSGAPIHTSVTKF